MTLAERAIELHEALAERDLPHAFGGALALAYATRDPRGTSDIDINVFVPAEECAVALGALPSDVAIPDGTAEKVASEGQVRVWWDETPVDLFFNNLPVHEQAARHARTVPLLGTEIPILGPVELAVFKAMFDRTRDWADIEAMIEAESLDIDAVRTTLGELLEPDDSRFARLDEAVRVATAGTSLQPHVSAGAIRFHDMNTMTEQYLHTTIDSPIGELLLVGDGTHLRGLYMQEGRTRMPVRSSWRQADEPFAAVREQLGEYFAGERTEFDLPLEMAGTEFEREVWAELERIPYGQTTSYGEIARRVGRPDRARAVGAANGRNPISVIVPCHRVIGADGSLTGYGGGLERKRFLLALEGGTLGV